MITGLILDPSSLPPKESRGWRTAKMRYKKTSIRKIKFKVRNAKSPWQQAGRAIFGALTWAWVHSLTAGDRANWELWAADNMIPNYQGDEFTPVGIQAFQYYFMGRLDLSNYYNLAGIIRATDWAGTTPPTYPKDPPLLITFSYNNLSPTLLKFTIDPSWTGVGTVMGEIRAAVPFKHSAKKYRYYRVAEYKSPIYPGLTDYATIYWPGFYGLWTEATQFAATSLAGDQLQSVLAWAPLHLG